MALPKLTQEPIKFIDSTPDEDYPLRILQTYRADCCCKWETNNEDSRALLDLMNEHNDQRAVFLDKAIKLLQDGE